MNWFVLRLFVCMCLMVRVVTSVCAIYPSLFVHTHREEENQEPRTKNHHPLYPPRGKGARRDEETTYLTCAVPFLHSPFLLLPFFRFTPVRQLLAGTMEQ